MNGRKSRQKRRAKQLRRAELEGGQAAPTTDEQLTTLRVERDGALARAHAAFIEAQNELFAKYYAAKEAVWEQFRHRAGTVRAAARHSESGLVVAHALDPRVLEAAEREAGMRR